MKSQMYLFGVFSIGLFACAEEEKEETDYTMYCDEDPSMSLLSEDADCDGVLTADDCDDDNVDSTTIETDADCDGILTAEDCDDDNVDSTTIATDADCDGVLTADDCNDNNGDSTTIATDADCDGALTADDCDDNNAESTTIATDADCDGVLTADDCDDNDVDSTTTIATDADCDGTTDLIPIAIGFEYSGIWNEAGNNGSGSLEPYLFPDLNNTNGGVPSALGNLVTVSLASDAYFFLGADATDEDRALESCTVLADFSYSPANLLAQDFDWSAGSGSTGNTLSLWQSFEGTLIFRLESASERCAELGAGYSLDDFDGMRFGIGMGPLSSYMSNEYNSTSWWAGDLDAQASYHTQYIAVNHPAATSLGYNFVAYDWTSAIMVNIDTESCVDSANQIVPSNTTGNIICGEVMTVVENGTENYDLADQNDNVGIRHVYVQGSSWWYEDYTNLDLSLMKETP